MDTQDLEIIDWETERKEEENDYSRETFFAHDQHFWRSLLVGGEVGMGLEKAPWGELSRYGAWWGGSRLGLGAVKMGVTSFWPEEAGFASFFFVLGLVLGSSLISSSDSPFFFFFHQKAHIEQVNK